MTPYFEYRHVVGLDETNVVGNVYFAHFVRWQGHCRELFLREHVPGLLAQIGDGLKIFTLSCSCEYIAEVFAFDEVAVRMRLAELTQTQVAFTFEYLKVNNNLDYPVATGQQRVLCMRADDDGVLKPTRVPSDFREALAPFGERVG